MNLIPLVRPHLPDFENLEPDIRKSLKSGRLTNFGEFSRSFEEAICELLNVNHAVCVSSATTGLILLLSTLPKGSEVLVPSFTFLPTVQAVLWNSLIPVFVDILSGSYNVSPEDVYLRVGPNTSAVLAVNVFGAPSAIDDLEAIARERNVRLFFDSAHAFGSRHVGVPLGSFGDAEVFSFSATKLLACGEGGVVTTNDASVYHAILNSRNYGFQFNSSDCESLGLNGKLSEFNAILGLHGIASLGGQIKKRSDFVLRYIERLSRYSGLGFQTVCSGDLSTYKDFAITVDPDVFGTDRNTLIRELRRKGVEAAAYFSPAVHQMTYFRQRSLASASLVNTEFIEGRIVSLPIYADLSVDELEYIVSAIGEIRASVTDL